MTITISPGAVGRVARAEAGAGPNWSVYHATEHRTSDFILDPADDAYGIDDPVDVIGGEWFLQDDINPPVKPNRPKWSVDDVGKDVTVTFNGSHREVFKVAKDEIAAYRERVQLAAKKTFEEIDPIKDVVDLFLGDNKPIAALMKDQLGLTSKTFYLFLGTYCIMRRYRFSVPDLYEEGGRFTALRTMI